MDKREITRMNVYRAARLRAAKCKSAFSNMDMASEMLFISRRTLWEIEKGLSSPSAQTVKRMAEVYCSPDLLHWFCHTECPIGHELKARAVAGMNIEMLALNVLCLVAASRRIADNLAEAVRSGNLNSQATSTFIEWSGEIAQLGRELNVIVQMGGRNEGIQPDTKSKSNIYDD